MLTVNKIKEIFVNTPLDENYNFLEQDLVKLARAFYKEATVSATLVERQACIDFVRHLNKDVARALEDKRGKGTPEAK
jgi:hypothetical protein